MAKRVKNRYKPTGKKSSGTRRKAAAAKTPVPVGPLPDHWPSLPLPTTSQAMSIFSQMHFIEKMPSGQQKSLQLRQIERVLRHAYETVPWYRDKLAGIEHIPNGDLDEAFFSRIPILTRSDVQTNSTALRSTRVPPEHGGIGYLRSSGSTGKPIEITTTGLTQLITRALDLRTQYWHRFDITRKNVDIRTAFEPGTEPKNPRWSSLPWSGPSASSRYQFTDQRIVRAIYRRRSGFCAIAPVYPVTFGRNQP